MNIEKQIKLINISLSGTLDLYRIWAKQHKMSYNALVVLYTLDDYKVCTQKQICEWWALPKQTVHGILLDFENKKYITISKNIDNKRQRHITFTISGQKYASGILEKLYEHEKKAMEKLGSTLRNQLVFCNNKYYELLKGEIENG